jgi:hypothetical protein
MALFGMTSALAAERTDCPTHPGLTLLKTYPDFCQFSGELTQTDPIDHTPRKIPFLYYFSRIARDKPGSLALVYPALTGTLPMVETTFASELALSGYHAIIVQLVENVSDVSRPLSGINDFFTRSNWSSSALIDLASTWPEVDPNRFNAAGVSLGGIRATIAFGDDLRLKHLVGYVSGGDLPEVFAHSTHRLIKRYREHWMAKLGMTDVEAFAAYLKPILTVDPLLSAAKRPETDHVYFVLGKADTMVPYVDEQALLAAYGNPDHRTTPFDHRITAASFLTNFSEVTATFEKP